MLDYDDLNQYAGEGKDEPVEASKADLEGGDLSLLPEGIHLQVLESDFPETLLWREGETVVAELNRAYLFEVLVA